jgi:hypothetical protein
VSIEASSFVLGVSKGRGNGVRKLILLGYANHTDKHGRGAYPSTQTIADYAKCDVRTVQRHVGWLLDRGYLHEGDQRMVDHLSSMDIRSTLQFEPLPTVLRLQAHGSRAQVVLLQILRPQEALTEPSG